jgi:hypothetical protein
MVRNLIENISVFLQQNIADLLTTLFFSVSKRVVVNLHKRKVKGK